MSHEFSDAPRIALTVDNPYRDLAGLVLVAWRLCQAGATCYLVPMNLQGAEIWPLMPNLVLLNYLRTNNEVLARHIMEAGIQVGILDTEGGIFNPVHTSTLTSHSGFAQSEGETPVPLEQYSLSMAGDSQVRHRVACYCAWSSPFAEYASKAGWYRAQQITVTGTPRFDFYAPRWREATRRVSAYADVYPAPMILINSHFGLANPRFQSAKQEVETVLSVSRSSIDREYMEQRLQMQTEALHGMAAMANHLAHSFPEATFIYRPHPFEGEEIYQTLLEPLPNLHLVKQGTVDGWVLRAEALIHCGSSTSMDAGLAGVPAFITDWLLYDSVPIVESVSIQCPTLEVLTEQVAAVLDGRFTLPAEIEANLQQAVENAFYKVDGCAHQRVADAILNALNASETPLSIHDCRHFTYYGLRRAGRPWRWWAKAIALKALRPAARWRYGRRWDQSDKHFDAAYVQRIVSAIESVAPEASRRVNVMSAREAGAYRFGYRHGRAVVVRPAQ